MKKTNFNKVILILLSIFLLMAILVGCPEETTDDKDDDETPTPTCQVRFKNLSGTDRYMNLATDDSANETFVYQPATGAEAQVPVTNGQTTNYKTAEPKTYFLMYSTAVATWASDGTSDSEDV